MLQVENFQQTYIVRYFEGDGRLFVRHWQKYPEDVGFHPLIPQLGLHPVFSFKLFYLWIIDAPLKASLSDMYKIFTNISEPKTNYPDSIFQLLLYVPCIANSASAKITQNRYFPQKQVFHNSIISTGFQLIGILFH